MTKRRRLDAKEAALRTQGAYNPAAEAVTVPLFLAGGFFDSRDLVQVKYEMLRQTQMDGQSVTQAVKAFGFSRPSFYQAQAMFEQEGLMGLLPRKRGPKSGYKLTGEVMRYLANLCKTEPRPSIPELLHHLHERFQLQLHPRSLSRALRRQEKKQP